MDIERLEQLKKCSFSAQVADLLRSWGVKGRKHMTCLCPIAVALTTDPEFPVEVCCTSIGIFTSPERVSTPMAVRDFITQFDNSPLYDDLVAE